MDERIPFHASLARWFPHLDSFPANSVFPRHHSMVWDATHSDLCLFPAAGSGCGASGLSPIHLSPLLHFADLLTHCPKLRFGPQMVIRHPKASRRTRHLDILGSMPSPAVNICESQSDPHRVFWDLGFLQGRISSREYCKVRDMLR